MRETGGRPRIAGERALVFQDLDESLLFIGAFIAVLFAFPFVMAWLEQSAKPSSGRPPAGRRSVARRGRPHDDGSCER
jgi:hypothetical protein